jgi:hypothetical protein
MPQFGHFNTSTAWTRYHESSGLRNARDTDATGVQWKRNRVVSAQNYANQNALTQVIRTVEKLKRRIVGGVGGGGGLNLRGEWDATQSGGAYVTTYSVNDLVVISLGINSGTFVWIGTAPGNSPPWTGSQNWMQLPGSLLGTWM